MPLTLTPTSCSPCQSGTPELSADEVWQYGSEANSRTVDVHVAWLRQKLDNPQSPRRIQTVRGKGYKFTS
jgi:DNA-binding response OmpR family regulator